VSPDPRAPWTVSTAAGRLVEVAREEGPRGLWFKLLGETVYRRLALFELPCAAGARAVPAPAGLTIGLLDPENVDEYLAFRPGSDADAVLARLRDGHHCFVSRLDGRLVHASWTARERMWSWYLGRDIPLAGDETCTYDTLTEPSARGLGIGAAQRAYMVSQLREQGYRRLLATIYPENRPSLRMVEKLGYRRIGLIGYASVGPWRHDFCRMRDGALAPGASRKPHPA
jgi:GNAT superfamily N-acetyltransferase